MLPRKTITAAAILTLLSCAGCLERKESLTVAPDGAVSIECTYQGDASEFKGPDPVPQPEGKWAIQDEASTNSDGVPQLLRVAKQSFAPGSPLPGTYATNAQDAETALSFPTSLTIEERPDGTYYHFKRAYRRRDDAAFTTTRRSLMMDGRHRALLEEPDAAVNDQERLCLAQDLRSIELEKQLVILDRAFAPLKELPQDVPLRIRAEVVRASDAFDLAPAVALLGAPKSEARDKEIQTLADRYLASIAEAARKTVASAGLSSDQLDRFQKSYDTEKRRRDVTEALNSHLFELRLSLPGEIVGANADHLDDGVLVWEFQALAFQDTDKVLLATSRVPKAKAPK